MSHEAIESFAIHPHNTESARVESLIPEQLRGNASNLIRLLQEYYDYMNIDGVAKGLSFINTNESARELRYEDLKLSEAKLGLDVSEFVPSTYNQKYAQLTEDQKIASNLDADIIYQGLTQPEYYIMRIGTRSGNSSGALIKTWVMASIIDGVTTVDFYDKDWQSDPIGSKIENLENVTWQENVGGDLNQPQTTTSASYSKGKINTIALTNALSPTETTLVNFTDIPTQGGNGQGLTLDIVVDAGKVVSVSPNKPGFGYRIDDIIETDILVNTIFTLNNVVASPTNVVQRILEEHDIDKTTDDYLGRISKEIAKGIPNAKNLDRNVLYKKIVEYYNTRGSEVSVSSFFKIFFDEIASVFYPKDVLFKASDGNYQGTADVSDTLEKYFYKKGFENSRRIHFYRDARFEDTRSGTFFIDFKFGRNFRKNVTHPTSVTDTNNQNAYKETPLFATSNVLEQQVDELQVFSSRNGAISVKIDDEGKLIINGSFGIENTFTKTIGTTSEPFVTGTNDFPFQEIANLARQRIRLAISIEAERNTTNEISSSSGTYKIGAIKFSMTDSGETDNEPTSITPSNTGLDIDTLGKMSLYPSMLGFGSNDDSVGGSGFGETGLSPDGELYIYQFAFFERICTDNEFKNFVNSNSLPILDKVININFDNSGSVNFTNKGQGNIIATSLEGESTSSSTSPIVETNYGLSATGTSYPRTFAWSGKKGFLSEGNKLHDSNYYQEFSYVVRTNLSVERWDTDYNKLIHPSGLKFFAALYLELASLRSKDSTPLRINIADGVRVWLAAIQQTVAKGQHSPKWQPGWIEYFFNVLLEIILYEKFSAFYKTTQPNINNKKDIFYDHESGLRIRQFDNEGNEASENSTGFTIKGNAENLILTSINALSYENKFITLDGNATGIKTGAQIDESSTIELSIKPTDISLGSSGKYLAGTTWKGRDGYVREVSVRQIGRLGPSSVRAEVMVTDNGAIADDKYKEEVLTFKVVGEQLDNRSGRAGVEFSDDSIIYDTAISGQSITSTQATQKRGFVGVKKRGHNLVILDIDTKKYSVFHYDTYDGLESGHTDRAEAEQAMVTKIASVTGNKVIIGYTHDASSCELGTGNFREYVKDNLISGNTTSGNFSTNRNGNNYSIDTRSTWSRKRFGHCFVINNEAGYIYESMQREVLPFATSSIPANSDQPSAELSMRYRLVSGEVRITSHPHISNGERGTIFKPLLRGSSVTAILSLNNYTKLKIGADGSVEQQNNGAEYGTLRGKLEASDPIYLPQINYRDTDWSPYIKTRLIQQIDGGGGSNGVFWNDGYKGIIAKGNAIWFNADFKIPIEDDATYNFEIDLESFVSNNRVYVGIISYNANGEYLATDRKDTFNWFFVKTLGEGDTEEIRKDIGGFNPKRNDILLRSAHPRVRSYEVQSSSTNPLRTSTSGEDAIYDYDFIENPISQATSSGTKFDHGAKFFSIAFLSNYNGKTSGDIAEINNYEWATLFKNIKISRADGQPIANTIIEKYDPSFGIKKISTSSLPIVDVTSSDTPAINSNYFTNNTFSNTLSVGTLVKDSKLAGVHPNYEGSLPSSGSSVKEYEPEYDTNLLTRFNQLPWRPGLNSFLPGTSNGSVPAGSIIGGLWGALGNTDSNEDNADSIRKFTDSGPFGNTELVWIGRKTSNFSATQAGGFISPGVSITEANNIQGDHKRDDFRLTFFVKFKPGANNAQFEFKPLLQLADSSSAANPFRDKSTSSITDTFTTLNFNNLSSEGILPDEWHMIVGYITRSSNIFHNENQIGQNGRYLKNKYPTDSDSQSSRDYTDQGIYRVSDGRRVSTNINELSFNYDESDTSTTQDLFLKMQIGLINAETLQVGSIEIARPRIDVIDSEGRTPTVNQVLSNEVLAHEGLRFPAGISVRDIYVSGKDKSSDVKYLITETDLTGITFDRLSADSPNHNPIPTTETSQSYTFAQVKGAQTAITLKNTLANSGDDGLVLKGTTPASLKKGSTIDREELNLSHVHPTNHFLLRNVEGLTPDFTIEDSDGNDVTTRRSGTDIIYRQDVSGNLEGGHIEFVGNHLGFNQGDKIKIADDKIGGLGLNEFQMEVYDVGKGNVESKQNALAHLTNDNPFYLTRNIKFSTNEPVNLGEGGAYIEDDFKWEKDKAYEISFNAIKINDKNKPANLFIGAEKIGHFAGLNTNRINFGIGNPNERILSIDFENGGKGTDGYGPKEITFNSSIEGLCRIYFYAGDPEGAWRLAHNGHQLRVDDTNTDSISRVRVPIDYYKTDSSVIRDTLDQQSQRTNINPLDDTYGLFVFESEYLTIGENVIQVYHHASPDEINSAGAFIKVEPIDNGLITEGNNVHKIYIPANSTDPKILIDHIVDRNANRLTGNDEYNTLVSNRERLYEYNWKIENAIVREKRKRVYQGNFQCIVEDKNINDTNFVGRDNRHPDFETQNYRPTDVTSISATDGAINFGGELIVPALVNRLSPNDGADVGQEFVPSEVSIDPVPLLGVPKGKYGVLKFTANNTGLHYISIGDAEGGFGIGQLYTPGEIYEISGKIFIPSTNTKLEQIHIMAGINPKATDEDTGQFINDELGNPTFVNPIGEHQIMTGPIAGYDAYGSEPQVITTKGSWRTFKHKFVPPGLQSDPRPVIRFVSTMSGIAIRGNDGYTGDANGEYFYIKDINIKEGYDSDIVKFKDEIDERRETIIDLADQVEYDVKLNELKTNDEACISIDVKHPSDTNSYNVKYNQNTNLGNYDLNLLPLRESNLLADNLPFIEDLDGVSNHLEQVNGFEPLGNPIASGTGGNNSPYRTTQENIQKKDNTPFGDTDVLWQAQNKDGAYARLDSSQLVTTNAGTGYHKEYDITTQYVLSTITHTNPTNTTTRAGVAEGSASGAQFTVTRTNGKYDVTITGGGSGYEPGDLITVQGSELGGIDGQNDLSFKVPIAFYDSPNAGVISTTFQPSEIFGTASRGNAQFKIKRQGAAYTIDFTGGSSGIGFSQNDTLTIKGSDLGGADTTNDLVITIDSVAGGAISTTSLSGTADAIFENVEIEDTQTGNAGVGAEASVTIDNSGVITNLSLTNAGLNYGRQSNGTYTSSTFPIQLKSSDLSTSDSPFVGTGKIVSGTLGANNKVLSYADGGFTTPKVNIDTDKTYRLSVWVKASNVDYSAGTTPFDITDGGVKVFRWYGFNESDVAIEAINITSGNESLNSAFYQDFDLGLTSSSPGAPVGNKSNENQWFLFVAHVRAFNHTGNTDHPDSGIYLPSNTTPLKVRNLNSVSADSPFATSGTFQGDWKFNASMKKMSFRAFHNANPTNAEHPIQYYAPRIDEINGLEPTIQDLTSGNVRYKLQPEDYEKKINIINWKTPIISANEPIGDYNHIIEGEDFSVTIDEIKNKIEYADEINGELISTGAPTETLIEIEIPASGSTNTNMIVLPLQKKNAASTGHQVSIDWGDGASAFITGNQDDDLYHAYAETSEAQRFTIKLSGTYERFNCKAFSEGSTTLGPVNANNIPGTTDAQVIAGRANFLTHIRKFYLGSSELQSSSANDNNTLSFLNCTGLTDFVSVKGISNTSNVTSLPRAFEGCRNLKHIDVSGLDTSNVVQMNKMFKLHIANVTGVTLIGFHKLDISNVLNGGGKGMAQIFQNVTFNSDELGRCYVAWADNIFCVVPTGDGSNTGGSSFIFHAGNTKYSTGATFDSPGDASATNTIIAARNKLVLTGGSNKGWSITDGGQES